MFKAGIVDPTKVTRSALQNAASIAGLMLTTEVMITKIKDDEKEGAARDRGLGPLRSVDRRSGPEERRSPGDGTRGVSPLGRLSRCVTGLLS